MVSSFYVAIADIDIRTYVSDLGLGFSESLDDRDMKKKDTKGRNKSKQGRG